MKYLPILFIVLATAFVSCKKEPQSAISGRWQETKLVLYQDSGNVVLYDTTYLHPFTSFDYIQFNNNGTCAMSNDYYYYINSPGYPKVPQAIPPSIGYWDYSAYGSVYVLTLPPGPVNPGGFSTADTVSINGNTLLLHAVSYGHVPGYKSESYVYYTKE